MTSYGGLAIERVDCVIQPVTLSRHEALQYTEVPDYVLHGSLDIESIFYTYC
jgi:hypothetical protein